MSSVFWLSMLRAVLAILVNDSLMFWKVSQLSRSSSSLKAFSTLVKIVFWFVLMISISIRLIGLMISLAGLLIWDSC